MGIRDIASGSMSLSEAGRQVKIMASDPSTRLCAAINGWDYPFSREATVLADVFDLWSSKEAKEYPRPWNKAQSTVTGRGTALTPAEFHARWKELSEKAEARRLASLAEQVSHRATRPRRPGPKSVGIGTESGGP